jgi:hypothetical protein
MVWIDARTMGLMVSNAMSLWPCWHATSKSLVLRYGKRPSNVSGADRKERSNCSRPHSCLRIEKTRKNRTQVDRCIQKQPQKKKFEKTNPQFFFNLPNERHSLRHQYMKAYLRPKQNPQIGGFRSDTIYKFASGVSQAIGQYGFQFLWHIAR